VSAMHPLEIPRELGGHVVHATCASHASVRVELPLEVMTLDVATPLTLVLDGNMAIFTITAMVEFSPEVSHSGTCRWCTQWG
jgi:hypothetical protein